MDVFPVTIGEAAARTGLTAKAIRLYESRGLVSAVNRTAGGYRTYGADELAVLGFIRQARAVGLGLDEIGRVLDLQRSGQQPCSTVIDLLDQRIAEIDRTMADLRALRRSMSSTRARATNAMKAGDGAIVCHLIEATDGDPNVAPG